MLSLLLASAIFVAVTAVSINVAVGWRKITELRDVCFDSMSTDSPYPSVSIIVSACNEARSIEPALRSLLEIDYPSLEIIAIDDRSTDETPAILDRLSIAHPALKVVHLNFLPDGWLGKNHALASGAALANGKYLLFTDADAVFAPTAVSRAMAYCQSRRVDHLALLFDVVAPTRLLQMMITSFVTGLMAKFQPWKVSHSPRHFIGIGGFNLVRASAYQAAGGHAAIRLAVLDDLTLGQLLKAYGYTQHVLTGSGMVTIEWYSTTVELFRGVEKNLFAAFDYRPGYLVAVTLVSGITRVWPWLALFFVDGAAWWFYAATVVVGLLLTADLLRARGWPLSNLLFAPLVPVLEIIMWWRACLSTYFQNGIYWRGTFYPLPTIRHAHRNLRQLVNSRIMHRTK